MVREIWKLAFCLAIAGMLLTSGCVSTSPSITPIKKNASEPEQFYPQYTNDAPPAPPEDNNTTKTLLPLPSLPPIPSVLQPKGDANDTLKLEGVFMKAPGAKTTPAGAFVEAWKGDSGDGSEYYTVKLGESAALSDGTRLEVSSLNDDLSLGSAWATYVIGGTRRTVGVGQTSSAGDWNVRTVVLYLPYEKVAAAFEMNANGARKELNVSVGGRIYAPGGKIYEVKRVIAGYATDYSSAVLSEGANEYVFNAGDEKPLPLGQN